ncbi:hypothetical protein GGF37_005875, partial [Kickxella alabastrina]
MTFDELLELATVLLLLEELHCELSTINILTESETGFVRYVGQMLTKYYPLNRNLRNWNLLGQHD